MATQKQILANRRNAAKSTGPRTESGKAVCRLNALRHGLRARLEIVSSEDRAELALIRSRIHGFLKPRSDGQLRLADRMARAQWQLALSERMETKTLSDPANALPAQQGHFIDLFSRRQIRLRRAFSEAFAEYQQSAGPQPPELLPAA